jgi:uncharacterized iron-regulated protein
MYCFLAKNITTLPAITWKACYLKNWQIKYPGKAALSLEMFQTDCQTVLNEYLAGFIREKNLITEGRAWQNYKDYRPMVELAKTAHIPVVAANAPTRYTNMVTRMGLSSLDQAGCESQRHG